LGTRLNGVEDREEPRVDGQDRRQVLAAVKEEAARPALGAPAEMGVEATATGTVFI
jgi:hypothetical protein